VKGTVIPRHPGAGKIVGQNNLGLDLMFLLTCVLFVVGLLFMGYFIGMRIWPCDPVVDNLSLNPLGSGSTLTAGYSMAPELQSDSTAAMAPGASHCLPWW